jgi:hypothetical protein
VARHRLHDARRCARAGPDAPPRRRGRAPGRRRGGRPRVPPPPAAVHGSLRSDAPVGTDRPRGRPRAVRGLDAGGRAGRPRGPLDGRDPLGRHVPRRVPQPQPARRRPPVAGRERATHDRTPPDAHARRRDAPPQRGPARQRHHGRRAGRDGPRPRARRHVDGAVRPGLPAAARAPRLLACEGGGRALPGGVAAHGDDVRRRGRRGPPAPRHARRRWPRRRAARARRRAAGTARRPPTGRVRPGARGDAHPHPPAGRGVALHPVLRRGRGPVAAAARAPRRPGPRPCRPPGPAGGGARRDRERERRARVLRLLGLPRPQVPAHHHPRLRRRAAGGPAGRDHRGGRLLPGPAPRQRRVHAGAHR